MAKKKNALIAYVVTSIAFAVVCAVAVMFSAASPAIVATGKNSYQSKSSHASYSKRILGVAGAEYAIKNIGTKAIRSLWTDLDVVVSGRSTPLLTIHLYDDITGGIEPGETVVRQIRFSTSEGMALDAAAQKFDISKIQAVFRVHRITSGAESDVVYDDHKAEIISIKISKPTAP